MSRAMVLYFRQPVNVGVTRSLGRGLGTGPGLTRAVTKTECRLSLDVIARTRLFYLQMPLAFATIIDGRLNKHACQLPQPLFTNS